MIYVLPERFPSVRASLLRERNRMKKIIVATATLLLAACATPAPSTDQTAAEEKSYVTGSRLPVKDKSSSASTAVTSGPPPPMPRAAGTPSKTMGGN